jgi:hypothetical protein
VKISNFGQSTSASAELTDRNSGNRNGTAGANATNFPVYLEDTGAEAVVKWTVPRRESCAGSAVKSGFDLPGRFQATPVGEIFPLASETAPCIQVEQAGVQTPPPGEHIENAELG